MRITLLIGIMLWGCVGFLLSGCGLLSSTAKLDSRIQEIDGAIQRLTLELDSVQDPEKKARISAQIDLLREERESLKTEIKVAQKAKEGVGGGIEALLGILGLLVGVPLLGSAGSVAKAVITGGKT